MYGVPLGPLDYGYLPSYHLSVNSLFSNVRVLVIDAIASERKTNYATVTALRSTPYS